MNDYKQDYCEWCGKDCTELSILRTCSNQCDFERASQLVEKWRHVLDYTKTPESEEENINRLKTAVILESEEKYYFGNFREERIAEIKKRYAEFHKTYLMKNGDLLVI
jgi:hypothetical protein